MIAWAWQKSKGFLFACDAEIWQEIPIGAPPNLNYALSM
jgi:hypothetical protein